MRPKLHFNATSCVFPAGPGMTVAEAALQVGQALNRLHPFHVDATGRRVTCAYFGEPATYGFERWEALTDAALMDLAAQLSKSGSKAQARAHHLFLVLPPQNRAGVPSGLAERMVKTCRGAQGFRWTSVRVIRGGHAAGVQALREAMQCLSPMRVDDPLASVVVLAVDSWLHPHALAWLEYSDLLHGTRRPYRTATKTNAYGRVPSEGAAALCLSHAPGLCEVAGLGLAQEPVLLGDPRPTTGLGWTQAAQQALTQAHELGSYAPSTREVSAVWSDLNGEPYRADQFGFTGLRLSAELRDDWTSVTPATVAGDLGAASAVAHLALAAHALQGSNETHLLLSASDDALRAAAVLRGWRQERSI